MELVAVCYNGLFPAIITCCIMDRNLLNLVRTSIHKYCVKPPGRKNWPRPMMLGPQTSKHPKFPGWSLYYLPVTDNKYIWFMIMTLFHFTGFTVPILGVCKMLKTMNQ